MTFECFNVFLKYFTVIKIMRNNYKILQCRITEPLVYIVTWQTAECNPCWPMIISPYWSMISLEYILQTVIAFLYQSKLSQRQLLNNDDLTSSQIELIGIWVKQYKQSMEYGLLSSFAFPDDSHNPLSLVLPLILSPSYFLQIIEWTLDFNGP